MYSLNLVENSFPFVLCITGEQSCLSFNICHLRVFLFYIFNFGFSSFLVVLLVLKHVFISVFKYFCNCVFVSFPVYVNVDNFFLLSSCCFHVLVYQDPLLLRIVWIFICALVIICILKQQVYMAVQIIKTDHLVH
jgi:hypothetical protein